MNLFEIVEFRTGRLLAVGQQVALIACYRNFLNY